MSKSYTDRGFRSFLHTDRLEIVESSLAFEGPHVRIFGGRPSGGEPFDHVQLSLDDAKQVRDALTAFIAEAEAGELTERIDDEWQHDAR